MSKNGTYLEYYFLNSDAFKAIRSAHTLRVLIEFYRRRRIHKYSDHKGGRTQTVITNNGEIEFRYDDAIKRLKLSQTTFSRALDELVKLGFIDVTEMSCGLHRQATKYAISERYLKYGTPDFKEIDRDRITPPFAKNKKNQLPYMNKKRGQ